MSRTPVDVAVGILIQEDGQVLLAQRPPGKPYAGWWEFPGGKLEEGESVFQALRRELDEELGVHIEEARPWVTLYHDYPHAHVRLHFCKIRRWTKEPQGREGQRFGWSPPGHCHLEPVLPATVPILKWLDLPDEYAISNATELGIPTFLSRLEDRLKTGLRLLQLREPGLPPESFATLFSAVNALTERYGARLLVNSMHPESYWTKAQGVHLRTQDLLRLQHRPALAWVAASCHRLEECQIAAQRHVDFVVLGPMLPTRSHPERPPLGWQAFQASVQQCSVPVYALGGLSRQDMPQALDLGAQGVALLSAAWA